MTSVTEDFVRKCKIMKNDTLGRFVVATINIKPGETLLLEEPILVLPNTKDRRCANCYKLTDKFCSKCKLLPLCVACVKHDSRDCDRLYGLKEHINDIEQLQIHNEVYITLKCLLLREYSETQAQYERMLKMEAHQEDRRGSETWQTYEKNAVAPLQKSNLLSQLLYGIDIDSELIQRLLGILDINAFEIRAPERGTAMRALYLLGGLFPHSCLPNLVTAVDDQYRLKVYANRFIAAGEVLYNCYTNVLLGNEERRDILKMGKHFDCNCSRCTDPTELGTHISSFVCPTCKVSGASGYIVRQPTTRAWNCLVNAEHTLKPEYVANLLERAKEEIFHAHDDIFRYELLLIKLSNILHGNHYIMLDLKQHIASILRQVLGNMSQSPNRKVYERKLRLCKEILSVLKVIQPGISRLKAIALYEVANTQAELARKLYSEGEHSANDLLTELQGIENIFRESLHMLIFEPLATPEGQLSRNMLRELKELQNDIKLLQEPNNRDRI